MKELVRKWALKNAIDHEGKAQPGAVIPKVIGERPELKNKIKELAKDIAKTVAEVNKLSLENQKAELMEIAPELLEKKKEEKKELPDLPNAVPGKVVMTFPPEPSKYATIGHAKACLLNYLCCKKYDGKFWIRFEDTNYKKIKKEYYNLMLEDLAWVGVNWNDVDYESDHIEEMYRAAEDLIKKDKAYMCNCPSETVRKLRGEGKVCECHSRTTEENMKLWIQMLDKKFDEGDYSLRAKIDMKHANAVMRDPSIMRVLIGEHPRTGKKYIVWPVYDFATAFMDGVEKITHRMRSKEFEVRAEIQRWIQKELGIKSPIVIEFARFNMEGIPASGRVIREQIANKELTGWDDPRLPTLISMRKRGFTPEGIRNFVIASGMSKTESTVTWEVLEAENRKIIEPLSDRYFFVKDKIKLKVRGIPANFSAERNKHPDYPEHGKVNYSLNEKEAVFYIDKHDTLELKPEKIIRLMDLMNIKIEVFSEKEIIADFESKEYKQGSKIIHWVDSKEHVPVEILMADAELWKGLAEKAIEELQEGASVQFIRFGYARLEKKGKTLKFRFTHS